MLKFIFIIANEGSFCCRKKMIRMKKKESNLYLRLAISSLLLLCHCLLLRNKCSWKEPWCFFRTFSVEILTCDHERDVRWFHLANCVVFRRVKSICASSIEFVFSGCLEIIVHVFNYFTGSLVSYVCNGIEFNRLSFFFSKIWFHLMRICFSLFLHSFWHCKLLILLATFSKQLVCCVKSNFIDCKNSRVRSG